MHEIAIPAELLTPERIDAFFENLQKKGRRDSTIHEYRRHLQQLFDELPADKRLDEKVLHAWKKRLCENSASFRTVNVKLAAVNSYLRYIGRRDLQLQPLPVPQDDARPELTRAEYLRLLQMAKWRGDERLYMLIKVFVSTGLFLRDLPNLTVEAVQSGQLAIKNGSVVRIPGRLQKDLLEYARRNGIPAGALFLTRTGRQLDRVSIAKSIKRLCRDARVPEKKATLLCLRKLHRSTYADIQANLQNFVELAYDQLMEQEEQTVGWSTAG